MQIKRQIELIRAAFDKWSADKVSRLAAALAFYTALSLAPLIIFLVTIISIVLSGEQVQASLLEQAESAMGSSGADIVSTILDNAPDPGAGIVASIISFGMLLFSASGLFNQLQDAFNTVWNVPAEALKGIIRILWMRLKALGMVLGIGAILVLTLLLSLVVQLLKTLISTVAEGTVGEIAARTLPGVELENIIWFVANVLPLLDIVLSLVILILLFAWMFKSIPHDPGISWRDVWGGAILTAILFTIGKYGLAIYLGGGSVGSAYGAAGSLLVVLVWVYYSGQILFLGAEYTFVYAQRYGSRSAPARATEIVATASTAAPAVTALSVNADAVGQHSDPELTTDTPSGIPRPLQLGGAILLFLIGLVVGARDTKG